MLLPKDRARGRIMMRRINMPTTAINNRLILRPREAFRAARGTIDNVFAERGVKKSTILPATPIRGDSILSGRDSLSSGYT